MRMHTYGGLDVSIAGGPDREGGGNGPVVILLHGFGAPGDDHGFPVADVTGSG